MEWFVNWFDSPYYPLLYQHRDTREADAWVQRLLEYAELPPGARVLDLACGNGRHTQPLVQHGLAAWGYDLAAARIAEARLRVPGAVFREHDMRQPFPDEQFNAVFNLFTSFGYFEDTNQNCTVLSHVHAALEPRGLLVIDYLNAALVAAHLQQAETIEIQGVIFRIRRRIEAGHIYKEIEVEDQGARFQFLEKVQALYAADFANMLAQTGFELQAQWGNYMGDAFNAHASPRLIVIARRQ